MSVGFPIGLGLRTGRIVGSEPDPDAMVSVLDGIAGANQNGIYYFDPRVCNVYQDVAGTVPAISHGDPVARIDDYYGNGWSLRQSTGSLQPSIEVISGEIWIRHLSDVLTLSSDPNIEIGQSTEGTYYGFHIQDDHNSSDLTNYVYMGGDDTSLNTNRYLLRRGNNGAGSFEVQSYNLDNSPSFESAYTPADHDAIKVIRVRNKILLPSRGIPIWENGVLVNNQSNGGDAIDYQINALHLGQRDGGTEIHPSWRWSAFFLIERDIASDADSEAIETGLIARN